MQRVANGTQNPTFPALAAEVGTPGYFADQNDGADEATVVDPDWLNIVQEEIVAVIAAASIGLSASDRTQLLQAIQILIAAGANALLADTGLANTYVVTPAIAATGYPDGYTVIFKAANANTGPSTLNVSAVGAVAIEHRDGGALQPGDIPAGSVCHCVARGGVFQLGDAIPTLATTALEGLVQLASNAQAAAMAAGSVVLTPSNLPSLLATNAQALAMAAANVLLTPSNLVALVASGAQVEALTDNAHFVTPAALAALFASSNLASNGHFILPILVAGAVANLIVNYGPYSIAAGVGASVNVTFDLAFPSGNPPLVPGKFVHNAAAQEIGTLNESSTGMTLQKGTADAGDAAARAGTYFAIGV